MTLRSARGFVAALIAAVMLAACGGTDMKNPESVAKAFLEAYKKQDAASMLNLLAQNGSSERAALEDAVKEGPSSDAHKEVFNPEVVAIMSGKGKVEGPRYDLSDRPIFKVAEDSGDAYTVSLSQANGNWSIAELGLVPVAEFNALPAKPPAT